MMHPHAFIFYPGKWIGEGKIAFSASPEMLRFYTRWEVDKATPDGIYCLQEVEMQGTEPNMKNAFVISHITASSFEIDIENDLFGKVHGTGVIDARTIAWEFHGKDSLEGFEVYELQEDGDYMMHAEYTSVDQFRTIIDGRIWKKSE